MSFVRLTAVICFHVLNLVINGQCTLTDNLNSNLNSICQLICRHLPSLLEYLVPSMENLNSNFECHFLVANLSSAFTSCVARKPRQLTFCEGNSSLPHYCRLISRPSKANIFNWIFPFISDDLRAYKSPAVSTFTSTDASSMSKKPCRAVVD